MLIYNPNTSSMKTLLSVLYIFIFFNFYCQKSKHSTTIQMTTSHFFIDTLYSQNLKENRLLTIYLPNGFNTDSIYPVIYTTDGQIITESYKKSMDSLIELNIIPKVVLVGVHSNETFLPEYGREVRNFEYIKNIGATDTLSLRFYKHYDFFTKEVFEYAQNKYSVSSKRENRVFYGASNGADFGVSLAIENPDLIKSYIYCSIVAGSQEPFQWTKSNSPNFYLYYGNEEDKMIKDEAIKLSNYLKKQNLNYKLSPFKGGHDRKMWEYSFFMSLPQIF